MAVVHDSVSEIAAIVCACFLMQCLSLPIMTDHNDFSTLSYRLSCACIPVIISIYAARNQNTTMGGCLGTTEGSLLEYTMENQPPPHKPHGFPVILVFHSIVSLSLFFMQYQSKQAEINIEKVRKLKKDLTETRTFKKKK